MNRKYKRYIYNNTFNAEYESTIQEANGSVHEIKIEFEFQIDNNGIGDYEFWGEKGFDEGTDFMVITEITKAYLIHSGLCKAKEECPKCSNAIKEAKDKDGNIYGYRWNYFRKIPVYISGIEKIKENAEESYDWQDEVESWIEYHTYREDD